MESSFIRLQNQSTETLVNIADISHVRNNRGGVELTMRSHTGSGNAVVLIVDQVDSERVWKLLGKHALT